MRNHIVNFISSCDALDFNLCEDFLNLLLKKSVIPSRMIYNWDFTMRPICRKAREYLSRVQHDPIINLNEINPAIYRHVPALDRVRASRLKLQVLF